ncbi:MAG: di-heme oxidoredictase family protein [Deltaproteobacteria bacterium]
MAALTALGCQRQLDRTSLEASSGPGGALTSPRLDGQAFAQRAPNSSRESQLFFNSGQGFYYQPWLPPPSPIATRAGLGPLYNAGACVECHLGGGRGRPPLEPDEPFRGLVLKLGTGEQGPRGEPESDRVYGEQLQTLGVEGVLPEGTPQLDYSTLAGHYPDGVTYRLSSPTYRIDRLQYGPPEAQLALSPRVAPATIGLGLLEALDESRLAELEDPDDADGDGISGRLNRVWDRQRGSVSVGRFGWKAEQPDLRQQIAAALATDLGVTSRLYPESDCSEAQSGCDGLDAPPELAERVLDRIESYLRLLAVPARRSAEDPAVEQGEQLFARAGCERCHVPRHVTSADAALPELQSQTLWPYTDLLLHDLGPGLADARPSFLAAGSEWRTPPLWGLGLYGTVSGHQRLLHDGRADGVAEAVLWHDGEAAAARAEFEALTAQERAQVVAFVESL